MPDTSPYDLPRVVLDNDERAKFNKFIGPYRKAARQESKPSRCILCEREATSFCNSHTVPQFCLKQIARNGKVLTISKAIGTNLLKEELGVSEAGTFRTICPDCDKRYFEGYEDSRVFVSQSQLPQRVLGQIAAKTCLRELAKSSEEVFFDAHLADDFGSTKSRARSIVREIDQSDFSRNLATARKAAERGSRAYRVIYYEKLGHTVPLASQTMINPVVDLDGGAVNNLFEPDPTYHIEPLFACILPMRDGSVILLFRHRQSMRCKAFDEQFASLTVDERRLALLKLIMAYSEEVFYSPRIEGTITGDEGIVELSRLHTDRLVPYAHGVTLQQQQRKELFQAAMEQYAVKRMPDVPNLLQEEYGLRSE